MNHPLAAPLLHTVFAAVVLCGLAISPAHAAAPAVGDEPAPMTGTPTDGAPSTEELSDAIYVGVGDEPIALTDGRWEGEPFEPGAASRPRAGLVEGFRLTGDLDGNGEDEAVVLLWSSSGGSGTFSHLAITGRRDGQVVNLATADIGDRVQVRAGRIVDGRVELEVVQAGPKDAACCPTQKATRTWQLTDDGLTEAAAQTTGTLSLEDLGGAEWILSRWTRDEPVAPEPKITLAFLDGGISGTGGCNRYRAGVTAGKSPGTLTIGPVLGTRMACPGPLMGLENRYFTALESATGYSFFAGRLVLSYQQDETHHSLIFVATAP